MSRKTREQRMQDTLNRVMASHAPQDLHKVPHTQAREQFTRVAVRDTLIEHHVPFKKAEKLAREHAGGPLSRLRACMEHL